MISTNCGPGSAWRGFRHRLAVGVAIALPTSLAGTVVLAEALSGHRPIEKSRHSAQAPLKIGLFSVRQTTENPEEIANIRFDEGVTKLLEEQLRRSGTADVKVIPWPANPGFGGNVAQPISQVQMIALGRQAGVDVVILASVTQFDVKMRRIKIPVLGDVNTAEARAKLEGALVDVYHGQVIGELTGEGKESKQKYSGPGLGGIDFGSGDFGNSLPGKATNKAVAAFVKRVAELSRNVQRSDATPARENPPPGLSFSQARYQFDVDRGYDQWAEVEVDNRDARPHRFVVASVLVDKDIVTGFIGKGSVDEIHEVAPGEFKTVRFIGTTPNAQKSTYKLPIRLYDMDGRQAADGLPAQAHDSAEVILNVRAQQFRVKIQQVGENPGTLAKGFTVINEGPEVTDLSVHLTGPVVKTAVIRPAVETLRLATGESVSFSIEPILGPDFRTVEGEFEVSGAGQSLKSPINFALPPGKKVFAVKVGSSETNASSTHY